MLKALIVENSSILSLDLKNRLAKFKVDVVSVVDNYDAALIKLQQTKYDLVIVNFEDKPKVRRLFFKLSFKLKTPFIVLIRDISSKFISEVASYLPEAIVDAKFLDRDLQLNLQIVFNKIASRKKELECYIEGLENRHAAKKLLVLNVSGEILAINKNGIEALDTKHEVVGKKVTDFFNLPSGVHLKYKLKELITEGEMNFDVKLDKKGTPQHVSAKVIMHNFLCESPLLLVLFEVNQSKEVISRNCFKNLTFCDFLPNPIIALTSRGEVMFANKSFESFFELSRAKLLGQKIETLQNDFGTPIFDSQSFHFDNLDSYPDIVEYEEKGEKHTLLRAQKISEYEGQDIILQSFTDISYFLIEDEMLKSERKFRTITNNSQDAIILVDNFGNATYWNRAAEHMLGYSAEEALGKNVDDLIAHPQYKKKKNLKKGFQKYIQTGKGELVGKKIEAEVLDKVGNVINVEASFNAVKLDGQRHVMAILRNITEKQKLVKELRDTNDFLDIIIDNASVLISFFDKNDKLIIWNKAAENITGYSKYEIQNKANAYEILFPDATYRSAVINDLARLKRKAEVDGEQHVVVKASCGKEKTLSLFVKRVNFEDSTNTGTIWVAYDITQQSIDEIDVKTRLEEKEILIKEIHHRVKNNLQVMNSLVNLQSRYIEDNRALEHFRETQHRIRTMALIQETIYHSKDFTSLNLSEYLEKYSKDLIQFYGFAQDELVIDIKQKPLIVTVNVAVSLALLLNEILTNALKYAFGPESDENKIVIDFHFRKKNKLTLIVADNGSGIPDDVNWNDPETLGLQLIHILASQMDAEIFQESISGTKYTVLLPMKAVIK